MKTRLAIVLIATHAITAGASSQNGIETPATCPAVAEISPLHLYGTWRAEFDGGPEGASVVFEKHPELAGSVSGSILLCRILLLCIVLFCTKLYCAILNCIVMYGNVLSRTVLYCIVLHCIVLCVL